MSRFITGSGDLNDFFTLAATDNNLTISGGSGEVILGDVTVNLDRVSFPFRLNEQHSAGASIVQTAVPGTFNAEVVLPFIAPNSQAIGFAVGQVISIAGLQDSFGGGNTASIINSGTVTGIARGASNTTINVTVRNPHSSGYNILAGAAGTVTLSRPAHFNYEFTGSGYMLADLENTGGTAAPSRRFATVLSQGFDAGTDLFNTTTGINILSGHGSAVINLSGNNTSTKVTNLNEMTYPLPLGGGGTPGRVENLNGFVMVESRTTGPQAIATAEGEDDAVDTNNDVSILGGQGKVKIQVYTGTSTPTLADSAIVHEDTINLNESDLPLLLTNPAGQRLRVTPLGNSVLHHGRTLVP